MNVNCAPWQIFSLPESCRYATTYVSFDGERCTIFCAPLTAARGIVGALFLESPDANLALSDRDREFLETLALQAATAIEHANLYHSAITDPLTGLLTHRQFQQEVEHAVRRAMRTERPLSLVVLDLDH